MSNLGLAYQQYVTQNINNRQEISNINTGFIRYTLPSLGFVIPKRSTKRLHPNDIKLAVEFSSQFSLDKNIIAHLLEAQEKTFFNTKITPLNQRQQRANLNKFISYIKSVQKAAKSPVKAKREYEQARKIIVDLSHVQDSKPKGTSNKQIILSLNPKDYPGNIESNTRELKRIEEEIDRYTFFLSTIQGSKHTRKSTLALTKRLLGWLYIKKQSLSEVSLTKLIPVHNIYPNIKNFDSMNDYFITKGAWEIDAKNSAKEVIDFVEDFFFNYQIKTRGTKFKYLAALITIAKNNYKDITDPDEYENYEDISVIRRLRIFINKIPKDDKKIELPLPKWEIVLQCLEELKRRADIDRKTNGVIKDKESIAKCLEKFLILGMFILVPPSRQRVIRELRIGETLKYGLFKDGVFVPKEKLNNTEEAKYFIHLQPEDYKTGSKYGEWLADFPDVVFPDGTTFYQYLDKWINEGFRDELLRGETHNYLFVKLQKGTALEDTDMANIVRYIFNSTIKQKIPPHALRTIFRTYLEDKGATQQELNSAAFWMRHDPKTSRKSYTKQTLDNKLRPAEELMRKINSELLNALDISS